MTSKTPHRLVRSVLRVLHAFVPAHVALSKCRARLVVIYIAAMDSLIDICYPDILIPGHPTYDEPHSSHTRATPVTALAIDPKPKDRLGRIPNKAHNSRVAPRHTAIARNRAQIRTGRGFVVTSLPLLWQE